MNLALKTDRKVSKHGPFSEVTSVYFMESNLDSKHEQ